MADTQREWDKLRFQSGRQREAGIEWMPQPLAVFWFLERLGRDLQGNLHQLEFINASNRNSLW